MANRSALTSAVLACAAIALASTSASSWGAAFQVVPGRAAAAPITHGVAGAAAAVVSDAVPLMQTGSAPWSAAALAGQLAGLAALAAAASVQRSQRASRSKKSTSLSVVVNAGSYLFPTLAASMAISEPLIREVEPPAAPAPVMLEPVAAAVAPAAAAQSAPMCGVLPAAMAGGSQKRVPRRARRANSGRKQHRRAGSRLQRAATAAPVAVAYGTDSFDASRIRTKVQENLLAMRSMGWCIRAACSQAKKSTASAGVFRSNGCWSLGGRVLEQHLVVKP